ARFSLPHFLAAWLFARRSNGHYDDFPTCILEARLCKGTIGRLFSSHCSKLSGERFVNPRQRWRARTEIGGERQLLPLARHQLTHQRVHLQIRAPETINRLLRVADEKQLARLKRHFSPFRSPRFSLGQKENNFRLQRIGVLKFVNKEEKKP